MSSDTTSQEFKVYGALEIDPKGDLVLDTSTPSSQGSIRVSSKALCLASPVFSAMLESPRFLEGEALQAASEKIPFRIALIDDDYQSLLMVLHAVHLKTRMIPTTITLDEFYQLAVLCDKYDLAEVFVPWVRMWLQVSEPVVREQGSPRWFVISWVFRLGKVFAELTKEMILDTKLDEDIPAPREVNVEVGLIPDCVSDAIAHARETIATSCIALALEELEMYNSSLRAGGSVCKVGSYNQLFRSVAINDSQKACDSIAVGALIRCLVISGLWPTPSKTKSSISMVVKAFRSMENFCSYIGDSPGSGGAGHNSCGSKQRLDSAAESLLKSVKGLKLSEFRAQDTILFPDDD